MSTLTLILFAAAAVAALPTRTYLYHGTSQIRNNPERGMRHVLHPDQDGTLSASVLEQLKMYNLTVAQTYWYLPSDPQISPDTIAGVRKTLHTLRTAGVKALFRFAYDRCPVLLSLMR